MRAWIIAIFAALVLHAGILLFGGIFFMKSEGEGEAKLVEDIDLLATEAEKPEKEEEKAEPEAQAMEVRDEPPPQAPEMEVENQPVTSLLEDATPRLEAMSLSALESALNSTGGEAGDFFGGPADLSSGGRIGGTGLPGTQAGGEGPDEDAIFDIGQLDEKARLLHQVPPIYPRELRQRKVEGTVYVVFVVDKDGRVVNPRIEASPHEAFQSPALDAVKRWRFEPAVVQGEKVHSKVRVPIRFQANG